MKMEWKQYRVPVLFTLVVMIAGSAAFFAMGRGSAMSNDIFRDMQLKVAYSPDGKLKLFTLARSNELSRIRTESGNPVPDSDTVVIGFDEANMMRNESLFSNVGDPLIGFFGIDTRVSGVLQKTETSVDDMHFLDAHQFSEIEGVSEVAFIRFTSEGMPKLFYSVAAGELPQDLSLSEGLLSEYQYHTMLGKTYMPVLVGSKEAEMMRKERLFKDVGDRIDGFFGQDAFIAGVLEPTGTALDMMHIVPVAPEEVQG
jgi:hypothetical protein